MTILDYFKGYGILIRKIESIGKKNYVILAISFN